VLEKPDTNFVCKGWFDPVFDVSGTYRDIYVHPVMRSYRPNSHILNSHDEIALI
jgi:hypothetical protein